MKPDLESQTFHYFTFSYPIICYLLPCSLCESNVRLRFTPIKKKLWQSRENIGMAGTGGDDGGKRQGEASCRIEKLKTRRNPSLVSLAMARTASKPAGVSSMGSKDLIQGLCKGVFIDDDKLKFWIDEKLHEHCFMVLARSLRITWGETEKYWGWTPYPEDCFGGQVDIDAADLKDVCWLEIRGSLPSIMLSPRATTYEVLFKLMIKEHASGWRQPVDFALTLPNGTRHDRVEDFEKQPKGQWLEIHLGEFVANPEIIGNYQFSLTQYHSDWKRGLVVKGVIFRPKY